MFLRALPLAKARALLKLYPTIADPGADKILLFAGIARGNSKTMQRMLRGHLIQL